MDIIETRRENLRRWVAENGTPPKERSLFSQLRSTGSFGEKVARRLEEQYKMGDFYLDTALDAELSSGLPFLGNASRINSGAPAKATIAIKAVTLKLQAGIAGFEIDPDFEDGGTVDMPLHEIEKRDLVPQCLLSIKVAGESMEPMLYAGDSVVINIADTKWVDQGVFAINYEGRPVIKRLSYEERDWWMVSENKSHKRERCRLGHCIVVGRVVYRSPSWRL